MLFRGYNIMLQICNYVVFMLKTKLIGSVEKKTHRGYVLFCVTLGLASEKRCFR